MSWLEENEFTNETISFCMEQNGRKWLVEISKPTRWRVRLYIILSGEKYFVGYDTSANHYAHIAYLIRYAIASIWDNIVETWSSEGILSKFEELDVRGEEVEAFLNAIDRAVPTENIPAIEAKIQKKHPQIVKNIRVARSLL